MKMINMDIITNFKSKNDISYSDILINNKLFINKIISN